MNGTGQRLIPGGVLLLAVTVSVAPFAVALLPALTHPAQFAREGITWPAPPTLLNFRAVLEDPSIFIQPALTTALAAFVICLLQGASSIAAAYAFLRLRFRGRDIAFAACIVVWVVPATVLVVPLYLAFSRAGLSDTFLALVLPSALTSPYALFLLRQSFASIPDELFDAAAIDGASHLRVVGSIVLPLCRPALATLVVVIMTTTWNSYLWPRLIGGIRMPQVQVAIASLRTQYDDRWTVVMAASVLALLPTVVLVFAARRLFHPDHTPADRGGSS